MGYRVKTAVIAVGYDFKAIFFNKENNDFLVKNRMWGQLD